jgi:protein-disulfide isomerase
LSGANPQITIVEFADLQCPYCRQFESWYDSLPPSLLEQTTLIYKHLPLPQHAWAQLAAEYAVCADSQRSKAFWHLARYLFSHQDEVTSQNFKGEIESAFADMPDIDVPKLFKCSANGNGGLIVERDAELAKQLAVSGTPTLFVDGLRVMPMHSKDELQQFLEQKLKVNVASRGQGH